MITKPNRIFSVRDDKVLIYAGVFKDHFITHQEAFRNFNDVIFHPEYHNDIAQKNNLAKDTMSDAFIVKHQVKESNDVKKSKDNLIQIIDKVAFVINNHFKNTPVILDKFRLSQVNSASYNTDKFIAFSTDLLNLINQFIQDLKESGLKDSDITAVNAALLDLENQRREQIETIQSRHMHTKERIDKMNNLWESLQLISSAADIIFASNPEIQKLFKLPKVKINSSDEVDKDASIIAE